MVTQPAVRSLSLETDNSSNSIATVSIATSATSLAYKHYVTMTNILSVTMEAKSSSVLTFRSPW